MFDYRIDRLRGPAVEHKDIGRILRLLPQPADSVLPGGHLPILAIPALGLLFKLLRFVGDVLLDAVASSHTGRDPDRLAPVILSAVRTLAVADGDLEFACVYLFDTCHSKIPFYTLLL